MILPAAAIFPSIPVEHPSNVLQIPDVLLNRYCDPLGTAHSGNHRAIVMDPGGVIPSIPWSSFQSNEQGESFHFARLFSGDSFAACMLRHEEYLALKLGLKRGDKVLDVGCGVGGPMRNVVRLSNADVTGINNNVAQVNRTNAYAKKRGLESLCRAQHGDFLNMPFEDNTFGVLRVRNFDFRCLI